MKIKQILFFMALMLSLSCEKDSESKYADNIIGKWKMTSAEPASYFEPCDFQGTITFKSDNTISDFDACENIYSTGKWRITDNILTVSNDELPIPIDVTIVSLTKTNMTTEFMDEVQHYTKQ